MPRNPTYDRDVLIDRARDLFWQRGWAGTSLKDLEETLKMKPGSFYAAFGSKEGLFALARDRYLEDGNARLATFAAEKGALRALQEYPMLILDTEDAPARACMLSKTLLELQTQGHPLAEKADAYLSQMEGAFAELFARAQAVGDIGRSLNPRLLAEMYLSDLLGLRVSAERSAVNAHAIAREMAGALARLTPANAP